MARERAISLLEGARRPLGELLIAQRLCTPAQLEDALRRQETDDALLGDILVDAGVVPETEVVRVLG